MMMMMCCRRGGSPDSRSSPRLEPLTNPPLGAIGHPPRLEPLTTLGAIDLCVLQARGQSRQLPPPAVERGGNSLNGFKDVRTENGSSQGLCGAGAGAVQTAGASSSSLLTSNLSKSDQLLTTHRSPLTCNHDLTYRHPETIDRCVAGAGVAQTAGAPRTLITPCSSSHTPNIDWCLRLIPFCITKL